MAARFLGVKAGEKVGLAPPSLPHVPALDFSEVIGEFGKPIPLSAEEQQETVDAYANLARAVKRLRDD